MNPRILVTGGSGLLGAYLLRWFKQHGYTQLTATFQGQSQIIPPDLKEGVIWKKLILPDLQDTFDIVKDHDWVIHAAGYISYAKNDKSKLLSINQEGTKQIVNACLAYNIKHLIYIGSIGALGKEKNFVTLNESTPWLQNEFSTTYGLSKYLGELEAWRGASEGLNVSAVLPSVILGTGDWHRSSLQIIDRVANKPGWYPPGQTGYVDVRDIVQFTGLLLEKNLSGDRWILNAANLPYGTLYARIGNALRLKKSFRSAPKWLARLMLQVGQLTSGKNPGLEVLSHTYGTFTYDASKSQALEGFSYHPIEKTIQEVVENYLKGDNAKWLYI